MSAETLRKAAALMRSRAEARALFDEAAARINWERPPLGPFPPHPMPEAMHTASWSPAVALAVADMLDAAVNLFETYSDCGGPDCEYGPCCTLRRALAVAVAYLGAAS